MQNFLTCMVAGGNIFCFRPLTQEHLFAIISSYISYSYHIFQGIVHNLPDRRRLQNRFCVPQVCDAFLFCIVVAWQLNRIHQILSHTVSHRSDTPWLPRTGNERLLPASKCRIASDRAMMLCVGQWYFCNSQPGQEEGGEVRCPWAASQTAVRWRIFLLLRVLLHNCFCKGDYYTSSKNAMIQKHWRSCLSI